MKTSILIASYCRPQYLQWNLSTLLRQHIDPECYEVLVLNDGVEDSTRDVVLYYHSQGMPIRYVFTGHRNKERRIWRVPGFAINIGVQNTDGEILVLTCPEMYHIGNTFQSVVTPVIHDEWALGTPKHVHDDDGDLITYLNGPYLANLNTPDTDKELATAIDRARVPKPSPFMSNPYEPFWMAMRRQRFLDIGGYDEDFIGIGSDDTDLTQRLRKTGCHYAMEDCEVIHLHHGRRNPDEALADKRFKHNRKLMIDRESDPVRNKNRDWGRLVPQNTPLGKRPIHLVMIATTVCNLNCPLCNQSALRKSNPGYQLSMTELEHFIKSSRDRNIRYRTIEVTGGEPSLWTNWETGLQALSRGDIADEITFTTNGHNAQHTAALATQYAPTYHVSVQQATPEECYTHRSTAIRIFWNGGVHIPSPTKPVPNTLPAECHVHTNHYGEQVQQLAYYDNHIYQCCMANQHHTFFGTNGPHRLSFNEDFVTYFANKSFNYEMCAICLCNNKVFSYMERT